MLGGIKMKGIILAGGMNKRLYPITRTVNKQLLPIYDKPMIYYPLSTLMLTGIRDILIISTPKDIWRFEELFGNGSDLGLKFSYAKQEEPRGLADAFIVGKEFIKKDNVCLILGDNVFFGHGLLEMLKDASSKKEGATVFGYCVKDPERYGVIEFDKNSNVLSIEEKPKKPKSNYAVAGLYFYDNNVVEIAKNLNPSARGELEITDVNEEYLRRGKLEVKLMGRGFAWLDTGTLDSLADATSFVKTIEDRQGMKIACIEEIAYNNKWIDREKLIKLAEKNDKSAYGEYLKKLLCQDY